MLGTYQSRWIALLPTRDWFRVVLEDLGQNVMRPPQLLHREVPDLRRFICH
jgi:hypothetical protein